MAARITAKEAWNAQPWHGLAMEQWNKQRSGQESSPVCTSRGQGCAQSRAGSATENWLSGGASRSCWRAPAHLARIPIRANEAADYTCNSTMGHQRCSRADAWVVGCLPGWHAGWHVANARGCSDRKAGTDPQTTVPATAARRGKRGHPTARGPRLSPPSHTRSAESLVTPHRVAPLAASSSKAYPPTRRSPAGSSCSWLLSE